VVKHVGGGREEHLAVLVAGGESDGFGEHGFAGAGVADENNILVLLDEVEAQKAQDYILLGYPLDSSGHNM